MRGLRIHVAALALAAIVAAAAGCAPDRDAGFGPDLRRELAAGREYAERLAVAGRRSVDVDTDLAIALGYLERHRIGLGGPFRLLDQVLADPRLGDATRMRLAWALLARTVDGEGYRIDDVAFDRMGPPEMAGDGGDGRHHLALIELAVREASDPRAGELAVRIAYALATAEGTVGPRAALLAAQAAAQLRDRELARGDALRLLRAAETSSLDPFTLLAIWRAERRFDVERPLLAPVPLAVEREAIDLAARLVESIRKLAPATAVLSPGPAHAAPSGFLGPGAAARLAAASEALDPPPQTPIVVAVDVHRRELLDQRPSSPGARAARTRFVERADQEERFVAELALLARAEPRSPVAARIALWAGVALRPYAQEVAWFPGTPGPSTRELEDRFGLGFVRFDEDVPPAWRPYYRRMLLAALNDLQRALPSLDFRGLGVHFGENEGRGGTLALHDPRTRTVYLPPRTGAGTIAHELAHDLDWQVALRRYRVRGDYATDRATRLTGDRLATVLQDLTTGELLAPNPGDPSPPAHAQRPAEVFARSVDWFVVASLAQEGRLNGYLSSVQDDFLTGYGTVTPPDITGQAGAAIVHILDEVAPLYPATRQAFLERYGRGRALSPYDLLRRVLEAPVVQDALALATVADRTIHVGRAEVPPESGAGSGAGGAAAPASAASTIAWSLGEVERARDAAFAAIDAWICQAPGAIYDRAVEASRRQLVALAAGARARGIAMKLARQLAGPDGQRWLAREFFGAPWPRVEVDQATEAILRELADEVRAFEGSAGVVREARFQLITPPGHCAAGPLMVGLSGR